MLRLNISRGLPAAWMMLAMVMSAHGADDDTVSKRLQIARADHRTAITEASQRLLQAADKQIEQAKRDGRQDTANELARQRAAFAAGTGKLSAEPVFSDIRAFNAACQRADGAMAGTLRFAIAHYKRQLNADQYEPLEKELEALQAKSTKVTGLEASDWQKFGAKGQAGEDRIRKTGRLLELITPPSTLAVPARGKKPFDGYYHHNRPIRNRANIRVEFRGEGHVSVIDRQGMEIARWEIGINRSASHVVTINRQGADIVMTVNRLRRYFSGPSAMDADEPMYLGVRPDPGTKMQLGRVTFRQSGASNTEAEPRFAVPDPS